MQLIRRFRLPAIFCAVAVLACAIISRPHAAMGICDDGPYISVAHTLASTGRLVYNGWPAAMLGWQLYVGAAFIKLFGFSYTTVRMSTVLVAMVLAFVLQRTLVHAEITERNATLGTLAFVLSPLYLMLSATFMSDTFGLFAVVICLYGCVRALRSSGDNFAIAWLCFAVTTNVICGTARQIAWLGTLVMVPSALWLFRARRRVLLAGCAVASIGALLIFGCMQWFARQPYIQPERLIPKTFPVLHVLGQLSSLLLDAPFLLVPIVALFIPEIRRSGPRIVAALSLLFFAYWFLASYPSHIRGAFPLEPIIGWQAGWVGVHGIFEGISLLGKPPLFLSRSIQVPATILSFAGLAGITVSIRMRPRAERTPPYATRLRRQHLGVLLIPFAIAYIALLVPRATDWLFDRYLLPLLAIALLALLRHYQDNVSPKVPLYSLLLIAIMGVIGVAMTHNTFSLYRARVALAAELRANGVPDTSVDNGWEYDLNVELRYAPTVNFPTIVVPPHAYKHVTPPPPGICQMYYYDYTPHIHAIYGVSFQPDVCYGPAPFAPVHYSRWLAASPGTLYVVRYTPPLNR
ncbi:MAG: hypothetical protein WBY53_14015 [Acidobacteriaceae bacterium]